MIPELPKMNLTPAPVIPSKHSAPLENALIIPSRQTEIVIHGFRLTATGLVAEGNPTYDQWENCGHWLRFAERSVVFWIGDWIRYGEKASWGETYAQAMDATGLEYQTLADAKYVSEHVDISVRTEKLSFQHHKLVAPLEQTDQKELLEEAEREGMTVKQFEKRVKEHKKDKKLSNLPDAPKWDGEFDLDTVSVCAIDDLELPPNSVDMIFTDPPYHDEHRDLYGKLGQLAAHVLKPGGYCMAYVGKMFLPDLHLALGSSLEYVWTYCVYEPGNQTKINKCNLFEEWRPLLAYKKPGVTETREWLSDTVTQTRQKQFHEWQQGIEPALKYIEAYTLPGQVVLDPFVGGGTTVVACKQLKRHYLAFDKDESAVKMTIARLNGHKT